MTLNEYKEKKNPKTKQESTVIAEQTSGHGSIFVVQKRYASHSNFDFRLEVDGVLKSWVLPKEPSMSSREKKLAIEVEDHPLDYANFEGSIPKGRDGAGAAEIWDMGTFVYVPKNRNITEAINHGLLEFELHGRKLKGLFILVRIHMDGKNNEWLLMKKEDSYAVHHE